MTPIEAALAHINALEPGEKFVYQKIADQYGCSRSTLSRRHRQQTTSLRRTSRATKDSGQHKLNPQQEAELVKYIQELTARRLPPTREMIRNFASAVAHETLSDSWVTRFLHRHNNCLLPR
ncbi:hypothetical protein EJ07DRAFT_77459, partial [Lizonia empirigonia]